MTNVSDMIDDAIDGPNLPPMPPPRPNVLPAPGGQTPEAEDEWSTQTPVYQGQYYDPKTDDIVQGNPTTSMVPTRQDLGIPNSYTGADLDKMRAVMSVSGVAAQNNLGVGTNNQGRMNDAVVGLPPPSMDAQGHNQDYQIPLQQYKEQFLPKFNQQSQQLQQFNAGKPELPSSEDQRHADEYEMMKNENAVPPNVDALIAKMASGTATKEERMQFYSLMGDRL